MAKKIENTKDFLIIRMSKSEAINICGFGIVEKGENIIIDDLTNEELEGNVYYIPILGALVSKETYEDWLSDAVRYEEDIPYEVRSYNTYASLLGIDNVE